MYPTSNRLKLLLQKEERESFHEDGEENPDFDYHESATNTYVHHFWQLILQ